MTKDMTKSEIEKIVKTGDLNKITRFIDGGFIREVDLPIGKTNVRKIAKMEWLAFKNALRLHIDSIHLFKLKSYPSAYFLSILAQEEIGKMHMFGDFVWHIETDTRMPDVYEHEMLKQTYMHHTKRGYFYRNSYGMRMFGKDLNFLQDVYDGKLESFKQNSVYVGLDKNKGRVDMKGRIRSPFGVKDTKSSKQITLVNDYILELIARSRIEGGYYTCNDEIDSMLNKKLYQKLEKNWKIKSHAVAKRLEKWSDKF
jgi:AbiV family abortive infection protein